MTVDTTPTADPADPAEPGAAAESADPAPGGGSARLLTWAVLAVVLLPILVAAVRVATSDWVPVGDSALIAIRSQDVLGGQVPLLGMWASTSWAVGLDMNHPGPLLFDALAVPVALFGNAAGSAIGMALINGVSVVGLFLVVRRRGGAVGGALALAVGALLCWSLGSAVLVEPWHATAVLLPFLLLAALAWSVADGDLVCLPFAVVVGSFILQTNLSYAVLVPAVLLWGLAGWASGRRAERSTGDGSTGDLRARGRSLGALAAVTVAVGLVCWAQPVAEQLFVERGYAIVMSDMRGTRNSSGCQVYGGREEATDAVDVIEWIEAQRWSNGKVGMTGGSYDGTVAIAAASEAPKALKAIIPIFATDDRFGGATHASRRGRRGRNWCRDACASIRAPRASGRAGGAW